MSNAAGSPSEPNPPADLGAVILSEQTLEELLDLVVALARRTVAGADGVSVSLRRDDRILTSNASDDVVRELDDVQYRLGVGPCVDAFRQQRTISVDIDGEGGRYAGFAEVAQQRFITTVLSVPLATPHQGIGALNFYSGTVNHFGVEAVRTASLFARQAAVLLTNAVAYAESTTLSASLEEALVTRDIIGTAKGIIMAKEGCSNEAAFARLRSISQHTNRKLRDVAADVVRSLEAGT